MAVDRSRIPGLGPERPFTFPEIRRSALANGVRVCTVEHRAVPLIAVLALVPAGASSDPPDRPGLAAITGDMCSRGMLNAPSGWPCWNSGIERTSR